ncbi:MAG: efflux RND transporter permease subunit, partial [Pseudomonadota bacterium]
MTDKESSQGGFQELDGLADSHLGIAGRVARFFINSPLSPLLYFAMMLMGLMGLLLTPRQEDPQISVPMVDIMVGYPGASADQVANRAIEPLERIMSEIPGVKHVYSASQRGQGIVTIEFDVGEEMGASLVKVNDKIDSNMDLIPPGVSPPLVKSKGIDDVP